MNVRVPTRRIVHGRWLAAAIGIVLAIAAIATTASPTGTSAAADGLTWKMSEHAWTSSSLAPSHSTGAPAIKDPVNGFVFPVGNAYYSEISGATNVSFQGSFTLGNVMQGGYRIMLANPTIVINSQGQGQLLADVTYCVSTAACANPWIGPAFQVEITTFDLAQEDAIVSGNHVEWTVTPHWASVGNQFSQEFLDTLPASLRAHFRASGSSSDPNKPPAPITVSFDYVVSVGGEVTMAVTNGPVSSGTNVVVIAAGALAIGAVVTGGGLFVRRKFF